MMKKATRQHTKEHNRILVLRTFFNNDSISRAEIARTTGLTRTTVSEIVAALLEEGLVSEIGVGESQGGKSPILLSLAENSRYLIGLDLAQSEFRGAVVNLRGQVCATVSTPVNDLCGEDALELVYQTLDQLMASGFLPLVGIGVGTPGLVNSRDGIVINAVNLDWKDLPLADLLKARYQLPVYVLNDSQAAAMGEYTYGENQLSESNLVVVNARHGLGAGIVINGRLFLGDGGGAGEIGHVVVQKDGKQCRCGNYGCLETVASAQALVKQAMQLAGQSGNTTKLGSSQEINLQALYEAFATGDPQVRQMVLEAGRYLGYALAAMVGTLNIQKIVLSGDMTCFGDAWLDVIRETVSKNTLSRLGRDTQVEIGQLGREGILLGASAVLANNYSLLFLHQSARE